MRPWSHAFWNVRVERWDHCQGPGHEQHFLPCPTIGSSGRHTERSLNYLACSWRECLKKDRVGESSCTQYVSMETVVCSMHVWNIIIGKFFFSSFVDFVILLLGFFFSNCWWSPVPITPQKYWINDKNRCVPSLLTTMVPTTPLCDAIRFKVSSTSWDYAQRQTM